MTILITRLSHIGDCVLTLPLLHALRDRFARATLSWVVEQPTDQLLANHPAVDHLLVLPRGWLKSPALVGQVRKQLRQLRPELVLDPQSLTKSAVLGWLSGAGRRIGFCRGAGRELAPWLNNCLVTPRATHLVDRTLELLEPLGIQRPPVRFDLPELPEARTMAEGFLARGCGQGSFAVLNPGAGWPSKQWLPERFGAVARYLGRRRALPSVVVWSGPQEGQAAAEIVRSSGGHALAAPATSLPQLAALLRRARLLVASDTGPLHLAAAVSTACVGLYGPTRPQDSGPYGPGHIALQAWYQAGTSRHRRRAANTALQAISVEMVCRACDQVLESHRDVRCGSVSTAGFR